MSSVKSKRWREALAVVAKCGVLISLSSLSICCYVVAFVAARVDDEGNALSKHVMKSSNQIEALKPSAAKYGVDIENSEIICRERRNAK